MATYQERFDGARPSYIKVNEKKFADLPAGTTVLIPSPADIQHELNQLDAGEHVTLTELRGRLADRLGADGTCPVMCGMNLRIVAELALEALDAGVPAHQVVPVWNGIDPTSKLASKLPGGPTRIRALRSDATS